MNNHEFKRFGSLKTCMICFRLETDSIHVVSAVVHTILVNDSKDLHSLITPALDVLNAQVNETKDYAIFRPPMPDEDPGPLPAEFDDIQEEFPVEIETKPVEQKQDRSLSEQTLCPTHTCSKCQALWAHSYICNKPANLDGLCINCARQDAVIINRPVDIEQIAQTAAPNLTGQEVAEIRLGHENTVWNLIHNPDGSDRPDWIERLNDHRRNLERMIESLRVELVNESKMRVDKLTEDMQKLSPEEREQYKRDAGKKAAGKTVKQKKDKPEKPAKEAKPKTAKDLYSSLLRDISKAKESSKPKQLDYEAQSIIADADKRAKRMQDLEDLL